MKTGTRAQYILGVTDALTEIVAVGVVDTGMQAPPTTMYASVSQSVQLPVNLSQVLQ
jgi:hypothetical protein